MRPSKTVRDVCWLWLPLLSSWLLMTAEGPVVSAFINRLPDAVETLAAMGLVISIAVTVESPIINLLATSTALVHDLQSYRVVRRFTWHWMLALTLVGAVLAFTALFDAVVVKLLGTPLVLAERVRLGLQILLPWAAAIAWRRFIQGVLIGAGRTRSIALGTLIRLVVTAGSALAGFIAGVPGVTVGAVALLSGVVTEALYVTWVVRPLLRSGLPERSGSSEALTYRRLAQFHLPLASTSVMTLMIHPMVNACLARLDRPVESIAAWSLIFQFLLIARSGAFALPEVIISMSKEPDVAPALRRFSIGLTMATALGMAAFCLTPLAAFYLDDLQRAPKAVGELALLGLFIMMPLPAIATLTSWLRGRLIYLSFTGAIHRAMWARLLTSMSVLAIGLAAGWPGIVTAGAAGNLSNLAELVSLAGRLRRHRRTTPP